MRLKNGMVETVSCPRDFENLIDKYLGAECADYYKAQMKELSTTIKGLYVDCACYGVKASLGDNVKEWEELEEVLSKYGYL